MDCAQCGTSNDNVSRFCKSCGSQLVATPPAPTAYTPAPLQPDPRIRGAVPAAPPQYATGRSPVVALILSGVIVGVGQFYNGDHKKGAIMFIAALVAAMFTFGLGWFGVAIWSAIDAYRVASGKTPLWT